MRQEGEGVLHLLVSLPLLPLAAEPSEGTLGLTGVLVVAAPGHEGDCDAFSMVLIKELRLTASRIACLEAKSSERKQDSTMLRVW